MFSLQLAHPVIVAFIVIFHFESQLINAGPVSQSESLEKHWDLISQVIQFIFSSYYNASNGDLLQARKMDFFHLQYSYFLMLLVDKLNNIVILHNVCS